MNGLGLGVQALKLIWLFQRRYHILPKLMLIDIYDSFTYNLVQMFLRYDLEIEVHRSDQISLEAAGIINPDYIVISPGPRGPTHSGISIPLIRAWGKKTPILGVCLGMQCINEAFGGRTVRSPVPMHGKTSLIIHEGKGIYKNIPSPFKAARYHSLMAKISGYDLLATSWSEDGVLMGLSHRHLPIHGVQYHPESFLTNYGFNLVENFLRLGPLNLL